MASQIVVPDLGESVLEATIARWLKQEGDRVSAGEPVLVLETDKVDLEVSADRDGVLARIERKEGEDVRVGDVLGIVEAADGATETQPAAQAQAAPAEAREAARSEVAPPDESPQEEKVTPVARRLAEEHQIDLKRVSPKTPGGRITKEDVERYLQSQTPA